MKNHYRQVHLLVLGPLVAALCGAVSLQAQDYFQGIQPRPIELGTSGGNVADRSRLYCCSGTLGALVTDGSVQYILSNNHVLARVNQAVAGEDITQPGAVDQNCGTAGTVAGYTTCVPIQFWSKRNRPVNYVDAAIAEVVPDAVDKAGTILAIGQVSSQPLADSVGLAVCKSGRTTRYTTGAINDVDVTVNVGYSMKCGGRSSSTATFADQMVIQGSTETPTFSAGGDSGSLIVDLNGKHPVGLLFAGNSTQTIANPIGRVLSGLGVAMVGTGGNPKALAAASDLEPVKAVKARHSGELLDIPGVHGHGIGLSESGQPVIRVFVTKEEGAKARDLIPAELEGVPVEVEVTEPFVAF